MVRLNKYLADCGVGSRRACDLLISSGRVAVNRRVETRLGTRIDERNDEVWVDGRPLTRPDRFEYILLHKPKGVVTTAADELGRQTVLDLVRARVRVFPVGRLDKETTGLLLLTNDGALAYRLTHPRFKVPKTYEVLLDRPLTAEDRQTLQRGVVLEEGRTAPCSVRFPSARHKQRVHIILHQGWKRQVRRMFAQLGYDVRALKRLAMGPLSLDGLKPGAWRRLNAKEVAALKKELEL